MRPGPVTARLARGHVATVLIVALLYRIADPDAVKPDDWDEDASREIEDADAEKPDGWLDDEPEEVNDPGAPPVQSVLCASHVAASNAARDAPLVCDSAQDSI